MSTPLDELIVGYLADDLSHEQVAALENRLRDDADARKRFATLCRDDVVLKQVTNMQMMSTTDATDENAQTETGRHMRRRPKVITQRLKRNRRSISSRLFYLHVAEAAILAIIISIFVYNITKAKPPNNNDDRTHIAVESIEPSNATGKSEILEFVSGSGVIQTQEGNIAVGQRVFAGNVVRVTQGNVTLRCLADNSELTLTSDSDFQVGEKQQPFELLRGSVAADITKQTTQPFTIIGPHASVSVMGTKFILSANTTKTDVSVSEGRVRFTSLTDDTKVELLAGESGSADMQGMRQENDNYILGFVPVIAQVSRPFTGRLQKRATLRLSDMPSSGINIRVDGAPEVKSIDCRWSDIGSSKEKVLPFYMLGDTDYKVKGWVPRVGTWLLEAVPYSDSNFKNKLGNKVTLELTIIP